MNKVLSLDARLQKLNNYIQVLDTCIYKNKSRSIRYLLQRRMYSLIDIQNTLEKSIDNLKSRNTYYVCNRLIDLTNRSLQLGNVNTLKTQKLILSREQDKHLILEYEYILIQELLDLVNTRLRKSEVLC
jgi:hypothetical protein